MKNLVATSIAISATLALSGCATEANQQKIVFAGGPLSADVSPFDSYSLLFDLIESELGMEVEFFEATDRAAIAEGLASGRVDMASIDPYGYVLSASVSEDVEAIAALARSAEGAPSFTSFGVARANNDSIQSLSDIAGKTVCYSDPASTAGYLYPAKAISEAGLNPNAETTNDFTPVFTGLFSLQPAISVFNGDCDLGFVPDGQFNNVLPQLDEVDKDQLKIVWESEDIFGYALAVNNSQFTSETLATITDLVIDQGNKTSFVELGYCETESDCLFTAPHNWGYKPASDSDYSGVFEACRILGVNQCED